MGLRDYVFNNLGRKLVSLCLASLIWFNVSSTDRTDRKQQSLEPRLLESPFGSLPGTELMTGEFTQIPIAIVSLAQDKQAFRLDKRHAKVIVSGERGIVIRLTAKDIQAVVDLTDLASARKNDTSTNLIIRPVLARSPDGITVLKVEPSSVLVEPISLLEPTAKPTEKDE
jgi:hypothetical protein